jgi:hypothetical protein
MYYVKKFEEDGCSVQQLEENSCYRTFYDAFLFVFSSFVGDPEPAEDPLDIIFGVIMIIVLLNVVIAIVSSSWENAVNTSLILLVTHRFHLLRRSNDFEMYLPAWIKGEWFVDRKMDEMLNSSIAKIRDEYDFWMGTNRCHPACFLYSFLYTMSSILQPLITGLMWLLGLVTFGLLWPNYVRKNLFGINPEKASVVFRIGQVEEQATKMATQTELMHGELKTMNSKITPSGTSSNSQELEQLQGQLDRIQEQLGAIGEGGDGGYQSDMGGRIFSLETQVKVMDDDMKTLHTKVDLVLEYLVNATNTN